jgi:hypothetical protein
VSVLMRCWRCADAVSELASGPQEIPVCPSVFRLHWWNSFDDEIALFGTFDAALASLLRTVRDDWDVAGSRSPCVRDPLLPNGFGHILRVSRPSPSARIADGRPAL